MKNTLKEKIIKELRNIEYYLSSDCVVQEKGLFFRVNPRYARNKAEAILLIISKNKCPCCGHKCCCNNPNLK
jgi:hypothetical protein